GPGTVGSTLSYLALTNQRPIARGGATPRTRDRTRDDERYALANAGLGAVARAHAQPRERRAPDLWARGSDLRYPVSGLKPHAPFGGVSARSMFDGWQPITPRPKRPARLSITRSGTDEQLARTASAGLSFDRVDEEVGDSPAEVLWRDERVHDLDASNGV